MFFAVKNYRSLFYLNFLILPEIQSIQRLSVPQSKPFDVRNTFSAVGVFIPAALSAYEKPFLM